MGIELGSWVPELLVALFIFGYSMRSTVFPIFDIRMFVLNCRLRVKKIGLYFHLAVIIVLFNVVSFSTQPYGQPINNFMSDLDSIYNKLDVFWSLEDGCFGRDNTAIELGIYNDSVFDIIRFAPVLSNGDVGVWLFNQASTWPIYFLYPVFFFIFMRGRPIHFFLFNYFLLIHRLRNATPLFHNKLFKFNVKSRYKSALLPSAFLGHFKNTDTQQGSMSFYMNYGRIDLVYSRFIILTFRKGLNYHILASLYSTLSKKRLTFLSLFLSNQDRTFFFNLLMVLKKKGYYAVVVDKKYNKNVVKAMIQHKIVFFIDFSFTARGGFYLLAGLATSLLHFALLKKYSQQMNQYRSLLK